MLISPRQIAGNEHAYYGSGETGLNNPIVVFISIGREHPQAGEYRTAHQRPPMLAYRFEKHRTIGHARWSHRLPCHSKRYL